MSHYSEEFKASIIAKMLLPNNVSVPQLSQETGIPKDTLYTWRLKHRKSNGQAETPPLPSAGLSSEEKFAVVVECRQPERARTERVLPAQGALSRAVKRLAKHLPPGQCLGPCPGRARQAEPAGESHQAARGRAAT